MEIKDKVFIVTGGASGLGAGTAKMLTQHGAKVVLADLNDEAGKALASELGQTYIHCDVTEASDGQAVVDAALALGPIYGLVNCAGIAPAERVVGREGPHSLENFQKVININLIGSFNMIRLAAAKMVDNAPLATGERGVLINTASIAAYEGQIGQAGYAASKAAIVGMTLPIARDLARHGVRCVTIAPGIMGTPMLYGLPQEVQDALAANIPFPSRLGLAEDFAKLVHSIIDNEMINGETIRLDGAIRLQPK
ncbi:MAG: 3-hydroxyacyl-CoA dehydrogenase [Alcaligenaceae bacterium]|nr:3-hydroxyacyl-CoA dehydrogenase [Alcaligenaceae bacterium]